MAVYITIDGKKIRDPYALKSGFATLIAAKTRISERLETIYSEELGKSGMIRIIAGLFDYPAIANSYRKKLRDTIEEDFKLAFIANELIEKKPGRTIGIEKIGRFYAKEDLSKRVELREIHNPIYPLVNVAAKALYMAYPWYVLFQKFGGIRRTAVKKEYQVAVCVDQPDSMFNHRFYGERTLIDEKELPNKNVLFIDESTHPKLGDYGDAGLNAISSIKTRHPLSLSLIKRIALDFFPIWLMCLPGILTEKRITMRTSMRILGDYIRWSIICENYGMRNYIRKMIPDYISKTTILRENGVKTWIYYPDAASIDYYSDRWDGAQKTSVIFNMMDYDYLVVYGAQAERFFKANNNNIKKYIRNGVYYSQIIKELMEGKLKMTIDLDLRSKKIPENALMVGAFDSSLSSKSPMDAEDGAAFGRDMLRLLEENPKMFMVFKVKYPWHMVPGEVKKVYERLRNHGRCLFFPTQDGNIGSMTEIIARTEIVISMAYTSTTIEALGAGKRAVYHDPNGKFTGNGYYYNRIPGLVSHDYERLKKIIDHWTNGLDDKGFQEFVNRYIKDEFDPYMDCKAISRFRRMLQA